MDRDEDLRNRHDSWVDSVKAQNVELIMKHYSPDVRAFDAVAALQFSGREAYGEHWRRCLTSCTLSAFDVAEVQTEIEGNLAVLSFLNRCGGIDEKGEEHTSWMRATQVYKRLEGKWRIIHEHFSVPFDMQSGEVMWNLVPESTS